LTAAALLVAGFAVGTSAIRADTSNDKARPVTPTQAAAILGHAMPDLGYKPLNLHMTSLTAKPLSQAQQNVAAGYAINDGRDVVQLTIFRAASIKRLETSGVEETSIGGAPAQVSTKTIQRTDLIWTMVNYTWSRNGLSYSLTVHLLDGLNRSEADRIAASIN